MPNWNESHNWYLEPANNYYSRWNEWLKLNKEFIEMNRLYNNRINQILDKDYEDNYWKSLWERLLKQVIRDWNKITFLKYLDKLSNDQNSNNFDDIDQIWDLQDQLRNLKEESEIMWAKDFQIIWWRIKDYYFEWRENTEYIWNNKYILNIDFSKSKIKNVSSELKLNINKTKDTEFWIEYDGRNVIKYYKWTSFREWDLIWYKVIDHKYEMIKEKRRFNKNAYYERWAEQDISLDKLWITLRLKFFKKNETD